MSTELARNAAVALVCLLFGPVVLAQTLKVDFDARGVARLQFRDLVLVDLAAGRGTPFEVGNYNLGGQSASGLKDVTPAWDAAANKLTWRWNWGAVSCTFQPDTSLSTLRMIVTISNRSDVPLEGLTIYPLSLQLPQAATGGSGPGGSFIHNGNDGPAVQWIPLKSAAIVLLHREPSPLYVGLSPTRQPNAYRVEIGSLNDDASPLGRAVPVHRPVAPGTTDQYTIELRFGGAADDIAKLAGDVLRAYGEAWPQRLQWPDRRPIGELVLSAPTQRARRDTEPNPRNYTVLKSGDVHDAEGKHQLEEAMLSFADGAVNRLKRIGSQGMIVMDLEGQQYPQAENSYVGDPAQLAKLAPEMDSVADQFFRRFTQAGLRCGLLLRAQHFEAPKQKDVPADQVVSSLLSKIRYAKGRWGCTIFYINGNNGGPGAEPLPPNVFAELFRAVPDVLLITDSAWNRNYAYAAPFTSHTSNAKVLHTPLSAHIIWPRPFSVTFVGDAPGHSLRAKPEIWSAFSAAVSAGDILAFRAGIDDEPLNSEVRTLSTVGVQRTDFSGN